VQKPEDALKSLQHALKIAEEKGNPEEVFSVRYNLGVHYGALKKVYLIISLEKAKVSYFNDAELGKDCSR
jgi:hypothetical protein